MLAMKYSGIISELLQNIDVTQADSIKKACAIMKNAIDNDGVIHTFSTGHSHMMVEEMFYRAGGLVPINPILDSALMLHEGALKSTKVERLQGYAKVLLDSVETKQGEAIIITSNSGINSVPIEMAQEAKAKGLYVIAITSVNISSNSASRHPSGKKLMDVADIVIDNCIVGSDASLEIKETKQQVGAVSSIAGIYITQKLMLSIIDEYVCNKEIPPVYMSANVPGGADFNNRLIEKYKNRIRGLY